MKDFFKMLLASFLGVCVALLIGGLFMFSVIGSIASFAETSVAKVPSSAILNLNFNTTIAEQSLEEQFSIPQIQGISTSPTASLGILNMVKAIDYAATDPAIKLILINTTKMDISLNYAEEIRDALVRFRVSGKPIVAYCEKISQAGYYLSTVADKIYADPLASTELFGISANILFFKDILDKLGVNVQLIRHGKYKSAGEQFIANDISKANREQNQAMVDGMWRTITKAISSSKGISEKEFNKQIDNLSLSTAEEMLNAGLIDGLMYKDEMNDYLCDLFDVKDEKDLEFVTADVYAKARITQNFKAKNKIAIIYADGEITMGKGEGISSDKYASIISEVRKDSTIKAVVLRVNSPGGDAQAAEIIRRELSLLSQEKPVIASYGNYAASGGYWISAEADKIFTSNSTLTGSIGVFSLVPTFGKVIKEKLNIKPVNINSNQRSDILSLMRPLDQVEVASMQKVVELVYDRFLSIVSDGRDLTIEEVDEIAQGRVWTGADAININLADSYGGILDALNYAATSSNLEDYRIVEYPVVKTTIQKVMDSFNQAQVSIDMVENPEKMTNLIYSKMAESKGIYARIPFTYQLLP